MFNKPNVLIQQHHHKSVTAILPQSANARSSAFNVHQHHNYPLCKSNMFLHFKTLYFHPQQGSISNTDVIIKYNQAHVFAGLLDIILQSAMNQKTSFSDPLIAPFSGHTLLPCTQPGVRDIKDNHLFWTHSVQISLFFVVAIWRRTPLNAHPGGQKLHSDTTAGLVCSFKPVIAIH